MVPTAVDGAVHERVTFPNVSVLATTVSSVGAKGMPGA